MGISVPATKEITTGKVDTQAGLGAEMRNTVDNRDNKNSLADNIDFDRVVLRDTSIGQPAWYKRSTVGHRTLMQQGAISLCTLMVERRHRGPGVAREKPRQRDGWRSPVAPARCAEIPTSLPCGWRRRLRLATTGSKSYCWWVVERVPHCRWHSDCRAGRVDARPVHCRAIGTASVSVIEFCVCALCTPQLCNSRLAGSSFLVF